MTISQPVPLDAQDEVSEDKEMDVDWLWPSQMPEPATLPSASPKVTGTGILKPETPEFVPQS